MSEHTDTSNERCARCGYIIGPAQIRSWWDGIGPYHSQCLPPVDDAYQKLQQRVEALRAALQMAAHNNIGDDQVHHVFFCVICDQVSPHEDSIAHAPDCPFVVLATAQDNVGAV